MLTYWFRVALNRTNVELKREIEQQYTLAQHSQSYQRGIETEEQEKLLKERLDSQSYQRGIETLAYQVSPLNQSTLNRTNVELKLDKM